MSELQWWLIRREIVSGMQIVTKTIIEKDPADVWKLLLNSNVTRPNYCPIFFLGAPRPLRCEHNVEGFVGERRRRCVSDKGTIEQQIDVSRPPHHLAFHAVETNLSLVYFSSLRDDFVLQPHRRGTAITRTTDVRALGWTKYLKLALLWCGIKSAHHHVFSAWKHPASAALEQKGNPV